MNSRSPDKPLTPFGKLVVKTLIDREMRKDELAAEVGVRPQYLSNILNGTRSGRKYLMAIIASLDLDIDEVKRLIEAA